MKTLIGAAEPEPGPYQIVTTGRTYVICPESGWSVDQCRCRVHRPDLHWSPTNATTTWMGFPFVAVITTSGASG